MAGGIFTTKTEVLPGAYINVKAALAPALNTSGTVGTVFVYRDKNNWGEHGVIEVTPKSDFIALFGTSLYDDSMVGLRQVFAHATKAYVFNINLGTAAKLEAAAVDCPWDIEAIYPGTFGNGITVTITPSAVTGTGWIVQTATNGNIVDTQRVFEAGKIRNNKFVKFEPRQTAGTLLDAIQNSVVFHLTGGQTTPSNGNSTVDRDFYLALEAYDYNTMVAPDNGDDDTIHGILAAAAIRLRDEQGREVQAVVPNNTSINRYNNEGVIEVGNSVKMEDGSKLFIYQFCGFIAGATAAATDNVSLTYARVEGAIAAEPALTDEATLASIREGMLVVRATRNFVRIEMDINSLVDVTGTDKSTFFAKNRVMRVLDSFRNWVRMTWEDNFVGKVTNNASGRDLLKARIASYLAEAEGRGAIQDFKVEDITVEAGNTKDSVDVTVAMTPADSMEKLYLVINVN